MARAIRYEHLRWIPLTRYVDDGTVEMDNNGLRVVALKTKKLALRSLNFGGERAAAISSLLGTAKLNGINPEYNLRCLLTRIADHPITAS